MLHYIDRQIERINEPVPENVRLAPSNSYFTGGYGEDTIKARGF